MKTLLKFYIEVLIAGIFCAMFGLVSLFRLDFIRPGGAVFVYLPLALPLVIVGFRSGLKGSIPCALLGAVLFHVTKGPSGAPLASFVEVYLSLGLASLAGLFKTYSKASLRRVVAAALSAEALRYISLSLGGSLYSGTFNSARLGPSCIDNLYFIAVDGVLLLGLLSLGYLLTKGSLYEYKI